MKKAIWLCMILILPGSAPALTLHEAVAVALRQNLELSAAEYDRDAAGAEAGGQVRDFFPKLLADARYLEQTEQGSMRIPRGAYNFGTAMTPIPAYDVTNYLTDRTMYDFSITLAQPVLGLYKINKAWRLKKKLAAVAEADIGGVRDKIAMDVIEAFCNVKMMEKKIDLAGTNIKELNAHLERIESLHRVGHVLDRDLFQVQLGLDNARLEKEMAMRQHALAAEKLFWVMGESVDPPVFEEPALELFESVESSDVDAAALIESGLHHRWEIRKATEAVKAAMLQRDLSKSEYLPELDIFARYTEQEGNHSLPETNTMIGVQMTATLFEWGKTGKQKSAAGMRLESARKNLENVGQLVRLDVLRACKTLEDSRARHRLTGQSVRLAEESLRITRKQYQAGRAAITDLLNDQTVFHQARTDLALMAYRLIVDFAAVRTAAGLPPVKDMTAGQ